MKIVCSNKSALDNRIEGRLAGDTAAGILVNEFEEILSRDKNKKMLKPNSIRAYFMSQSIQKANIVDLNLDARSMQLLSNSLLLLRFFQEIAVENILLSDLEQIDNYKDYAKHINILGEIYRHYVEYLDVCNYEDMITLPKKVFENNFDISDNAIKYLNENKEFRIIYDGIVSKFDEKIFKLASKYAVVRIVFKTDDYYFKTIERLQNYTHDKDIEPDMIGEININTGEVFLSSIPETKEYDIDAFGFKFSITYPDFILKQLKKQDRKNAVVICTSAEEYNVFKGNENFIFPVDSNINKTSLYKHLNSCLLKLQDQNNVVNNLIFNRIVNSKNIPISELFELEHNECDLFNSLKTFIEKYFIEYTDQELEAVRKTFNALSEYQMSIGHLSFLSMFELFMFELSFSVMEEDSDKIKVYMMSDSRGVDVEHLFVVGMEKGKFPTFAKKDMFLDTSTREEMNMPTFKDRADLQKHYLLNLIAKANENNGIVNFCFVSSDSKKPSAFLSEIGVFNFKKIDDQKLLSIENDDEFDYDFTQYTKTSLVDEKHSSFQTLSASKLKTYIDCKKKYFYKYIQSLYENDEIDDLGSNDREFGNIIHKALSSVVNESTVFTSFEEFKAQILNTVESLLDPSNTEFDFNFEHWSKKMDALFLSDFNRLKAGERTIEAVERSLKTDFMGIAIEGRPDRIDINQDGSISIIDYKTGKTPKLSVSGKGENDFQPEFMKVLVRRALNIDENISIEFYYKNLKTGKEEKAVSSIERDEAFISAIKDFTQDSGEYSMNKSKSKCDFCQFKAICGR